MKNSVQNIFLVVTINTFGLFLLILEGLDPYIKGILPCDSCGWALIVALLVDIALCIWAVFMYAEASEDDLGEEEAV
jgi:hypothetical protein